MSNPVNSGVRNLRAMFENKTGEQSTSPPSRGRSPANSEQSGNSRPVSKVRSSFVAVERSGEQGQQWGLRKASDVSTNQPMEGVKEDIAVEDGPVNGVEQSSTSEEPKAASFHPQAEGTPSKQLPEEKKSDAVATPATNENSAEGNGLGDILKGSAFDTSVPKNAEAEAGIPKARNEAASESKPAAVSEAPETKGKASQSTKSTTTTPKPSSKNEAPPSSATKTLPSRPGRITTSKDEGASKTAPKTSPSKSATKSPTLPRTPRTPLTPSHKSSKVDSPSKLSPAGDAKKEVAQKKDVAQPTKKPSRASLVSTKDAPAAKTASPKTNGVKEPTHTSPNNKPKPKSPTRPARLPAAALASTAASAAKTGGPPSRSPSRASTASKIVRKPSTLKRDRPSHATGPTATSTVRKQASRPSLTSHANGKAHDRPKSRVSSVADEGFLARMMRPTASSASKTHEKIETKSPPRKTGAGPKPKHKSEAKIENKENGSPVEASAKSIGDTGEKVEARSQDPQAAAVESVADSKAVEA